MYEGLLQQQERKYKMEKMLLDINLIVNKRYSLTSTSTLSMVLTHFTPYKTLSDIFPVDPSQARFYFLHVLSSKVTFFITPHWQANSSTIFPPIITSNPLITSTFNYRTKAVYRVDVWKRK